jgi:hypothetical protein
MIGSGVSCLLAACGRVDSVVGAEVPPALGAAGAAAAAVDAAADAGSDAQLPRAVYIEAEDGELAGFTVQADPQTSGGAYIASPADSRLTSLPGDASARYSFAVAPGQYFLWGRIRAPGVGSNTLWMTLDGTPAYLWRLSTGVIWFWGKVTNGTSYFAPIALAVDGGTHELVVHGADPNVGLDRIYVTSLGDTPLPANDTPCDPPNSIELADGGCLLSCGSHDNGTCVAGPEECGGAPLLPSYDCTACCHPPADAGTD